MVCTIPSIALLKLALYGRKNLPQVPAHWLLDYPIEGEGSDQCSDNSMYRLCIVSQKKLQLHVHVQHSTMRTVRTVHNQQQRVQ